MRPEAGGFLSYLKPNAYSLTPISVVLDGLEPSSDWVPVFYEYRAGAFAAGLQDYEPGVRDQDSGFSKTGV